VEELVYHIIAQTVP